VVAMFYTCFVLVLVRGGSFSGNGGGSGADKLLVMSLLPVVVL
jgi:hypothetical protein